MLVSSPADGTLTLNSNGSFTYTPGADFDGMDSFTYKANDGETDSNTVIVTITVKQVNDAPVANNDTYSVQEGNTLNVAFPGVLANDSDVEGDSLIAIKVSDPANGSLILNGDGSLTYTPDANFNGTDTFTYKANDGSSDSNIATSTINVNPIIINPIITASAEPGGLINPYGSLVVAYQGSVTFTASPNTGYYFVGFFVDGSIAGTDLILTLNNITQNHIVVASFALRTNALDDIYETNEDTALIVNAPGILINDSDIDGYPLTAIKVTDPANGSLILNGDGSLTYTPDANFNGTDTFTYRANNGTRYSNIATVTVIVNQVDNTSEGGDVEVQPVDEGSGYSPVTLTFSQVTTAGETTLTISLEGPVEPGGFSFGDPPVYYNIETTAEYTGTVEICITPSSGVTDSDRLLHYEDGVWVDTTTSVDTANGTICGEVTSVSPFVIAKPQIANILAFFDTSVDEGTLVGNSSGNSADGQLTALRNMIKAAGDLIDDGLIGEACQQLLDAYDKCDGEPRPPDFVSGPAVVELANLIQNLIISLGG